MNLNQAKRLNVGDTVSCVNREGDAMALTISKIEVLEDFDCVEDSMVLILDTSGSKHQFFIDELT